MTTFRLLVLTAVTLAGLPTGAGAWETTLSGRAASSDYPGAMAADPTGGVVVAGTTFNQGTGPDLTVVKIAVDGTERWRRTVSGAIVDASSRASAVVVTASGDVIVGGELAAESGTEFVVLRLAAADGAEQWRFAEPGNAMAVAVDPAGDVVAAGRLHSSGERVFGVVKLAGASGHERWRYTTGGFPRSVSLAIGSGGNVVTAVSFDSSAALLAVSGDTGAVSWATPFVKASAIAIDGKGDIVGVGTLDGDGGTGTDILVFKLSAAGTGMWGTRIDGPDHRDDEGLGLAVAPWGGIGVVGRFGNAAPPWGGSDLAVLGLLPGGQIAWQQTFRGTRADGWNRGFALAGVPGNSPDPVVVGMLENGGYFDLFVARLAWQTGAEVWRQTIDGGGDDDFRWVTVATDGSVVVAGALSAGKDERHIGVVNLAAESGAERWRRRVQGTGSMSRDWLRVITTDPAGDVVAAGLTDSSTEKAAMTVAKFSGATGAEVWRRYSDTGGYDDRSAWRAVVTDAAGDVFAVGLIAPGELESRSMVAVKLSGATGAELWKRVIDGKLFAARSFAEANAVAVHPSGDVVVAGEIQNDTTGTDFAVLRLSGATGEERWHAFARGTEQGEFSDNAARCLRVDPAGDVVVAGELEGQGSDGDIAVVKLVGETGAERWRRVFDDLPGGEWSATLAVDRAGDVAVAGVVPSAASRDGALLVAKLAGGDGTERWRRDIGPVSVPGDGVGLPGVALDAVGHVVVAASVLHGTGGADPISEFAVMKLDAATGAELWRPSTRPGFIGEAYALGQDGAGDLFAAGWLSFGERSGPVVLKFAGATGEELWRRDLQEGSVLKDLWVTVLGVDRGGNLALGGFSANPGMSDDWAVLKISGASGLEEFCGDGAPAAGEECDDGNVRDGDGCSAVCALLVDTPPDACAGDRVPRRITGGFQKARRTLHAAEGAAQGRRRKRLLGRTTTTLRQVHRAIQRAAHRRGRRLSGPCADALRAIFSEMTARAATLRAG